MGKIKRARQKYHTAAVRLGPEAEGKPENQPQTTKLPSLPLPLGTPVFPTSGLFHGPDPVATLSVEHDRQSVVSGRSIRTEGGTRISKKDKRKMRHDVFLQKLEAAHTAKRKAKETKRRQQTAVVGDMQPLKDALPQLTAYLEQQQGGAAAAAEEKKEKEGTLKQKERKRIEPHNLPLSISVVGSLTCSRCGSPQTQDLRFYIPYERMSLTEARYSFSPESSEEIGVKCLSQGHNSGPYYGFEPQKLQILGQQP